MKNLQVLNNNKEELLKLEIRQNNAEENIKSVEKKISGIFNRIAENSEKTVKIESNLQNLIKQFDLFNEKNSINIKQILFACIFSILLSGFLNKFLNRFLLGVAK